MRNNQSKEADGTCNSCGNAGQQYRNEGNHDTGGIDIQSKASGRFIFQRHQITFPDKQAGKKQSCHNVRNQRGHIIPGFLCDIGLHNRSHTGHVSAAHTVKSTGKSGKQCIYRNTGKDNTKRTQAALPGQAVHHKKGDDTSKKRNQWSKEVQSRRKCRNQHCRKTGSTGNTDQSRISQGIF